jgi:hypothetical protein
MENEKKVPVQTEGDSLSQAAKIQNRLAVGLLDGRVHGTQDERVRQADLLNRLTKDAGTESFQVHDDVGKLGHVFFPGQCLDILTARPGPPGHAAQ